MGWSRLGLAAQVKECTDGKDYQPHVRIKGGHGKTVFCFAGSPTARWNCASVSAVGSHGAPTIKLNGKKLTLQMMMMQVQGQYHNLHTDICISRPAAQKCFLVGRFSVGMNSWTA